MDFVSAFAVALEGSALGHLMRENPWLYPLANILHVLGVALLVGGVATFDLAVLRRLPAVRAVVRAGLPVAAAGLLLAIASGCLLFAAEASTLMRNPIFVAKLASVGLGLVNVGLFHLVFAGSLRRGEALAGAQPYALVSLMAWTAALLLGRAIAYV